MKLNFRDLNIDTIAQWSKAYQAIVIACAAIVVIGIGYWLMVSANFEEYNLLVDQEATLKTEFESNYQKAANLKQYKDQMLVMEEKFGTMLQQLPSKNEMPALLEDISRTGVASGLTFELFAPMPELDHDFYIELPIKISVVGNYHEIAIFLSRVAQLARIVTIHDFTIEIVKEDKQKPSGDVLVMNMTAKIYRYKK